VVAGVEPLILSAMESLLHPEIVSVVYGECESAEDRDAVRAMLAGVGTEFERETAQLGAALPEADRKARLHRLKGMLGNFGFGACGAYLALWERDLGREPGTGRDELVVLFARSRDELRGRYPWLG
jgi:hypothetical protein